MEAIADYVLIRSLGKGNHGQFFLAQTPARLGLPAEHVAVKVLGGNSGEEALRRATRELRAFHKVQSPYLVPLYDAGQEGGRFFYTMPFFERGSLDRPASPLGHEAITRAVADAALAAHALHEAGIVHRGIKPTNILLTDSGALLSDLGLVQALAPGQTVTGLGPVESVEYLDPTLLTGSRATRATDIWSLAVSWHQALTGTSVYGDLAGNDPLLAIRRVLTSQPTLADGLSTGEANLIRQCLASDHTQRPATALQLAEALQKLAAGG